MNLPVAVIGFGGHGRVVAAALQAAGRQVIAATDLKPQACSTNKVSFEILTDNQLIAKFPPDTVALALGVGSLWPCNHGCVRCRQADNFRQLGYRIVGVHHPGAWVAPSALIADTAQIHAGVIVQPGAVIGDYAILNTKSSIDHDCVVGSCCHVAPGATLSGNVTVGAGSHIGTGANIIQGIEIGARSFVAAGATVTSNVPSGTFVRGTPARAFKPKRIDV